MGELRGSVGSSGGCGGTRVGAAAPLCRPGRAPYLSGEVLDTQPLATGSLGRQGSASSRLRPGPLYCPVHLERGAVCFPVKLR